MMGFVVVSISCTVQLQLLQLTQGLASCMRLPRNHANKLHCLQDERKKRGYNESILVPNDPARNEKYVNRIKCLKHNARAAVVLQPQLLSQSFLLADLVGMTIAGLAMCLAVGAIYVATRFSTNQLSGAYVTIIVVGYMLKDRVKEWGKRYLQPAAMKFGFEFPDRTVKVSLPALTLTPFFLFSSQSPLVCCPMLFACWQVGMHDVFCLLWF